MFKVPMVTLYPLVTISIR